ncbi:hypothetical protein U3A58_19965 [Algoriphagus sp. C2-6-M1]|uniref:hypothetical protein n=1 Tax=Algoriphagus persicinus TaxID=3108754 RepID=UPI002B388FE5|nr:hypothetical protein [Algoriphagus sp. C2-6-M1]MEB2782675.1 hypothetical protein [Algoriphagus sp. C2-6-M1]
MNTLIKRLPIMAFVLAAFAAFAFSSPSAPQYAQDSSDPGIWYDLTNVTPSSTTYECDDVEDICTRVLPNSSAAMVAEGEFVKKGTLPIHNP